MPIEKKPTKKRQRVTAAMMEYQILELQNEWAYDVFMKRLEAHLPKHDFLSVKAVIMLEKARHTHPKPEELQIIAQGAVHVLAL